MCLKIRLSAAAVFGIALAAAAPFRIASGGKASATIVVSARASAVERFVAGELQDYLGRITGAAFEIRDDQQGLPSGLRSIQVGRTLASQRLKIRPEKLEREAYRIKTAGSDLFLTGDDDDGTQFAVYDFLERYCGVRWFWPGENGEEVPRKPDLAVGVIDLREAPYFQRRTMSLAARGAANEAKPQWQGFGRKWRLGAGVKTVGVHAWGQIAPPAVYGPVHPEYFALVNGTRQRDWTKFDGSHEYQLCTSNPDVVRLSIEWARKYFTQHPDVDILSISPNDGLGFCECDRCRALDSGQTKETRDNPFALEPRDQRAQAVLSDRMFTYANAVAEGVAATHPAKRVLMLAYSSYRQPPRRITINSHVVVQYADNADFHWDPQRKAERLGGLQEWARLTPNLMIYEYYVWGANSPTRGLTPVIAGSIKHLHRLGIRLFRTQARADFGLNGLNYYLAARLLWNPDLNPEEILNDYAVHCFGGGAAEMRRYFHLLDERWKVAVTSIGAKYTPQNALYYLAAYNPQVRADLRRILERAKIRATTPANRARVEFFEKAHRYTELSMEAAEATIDLGRAGVVTLEKEYPGIFNSPTEILDFKKPSDLSPSERKKAADLVAAAISKWEKRERFLDSIEGQPVMDVRAARTYDNYYHFNPLKKLREMEQLYARGAN